MPVAEARALSIQSQYAVELIALQAAAMAGQLIESLPDNPTQKQIDDASAQYALLLAGAMKATSAARTGYLQGFAQAAGQQAFKIPAGVASPKPADILMGGLSPQGAIRHAVDMMGKWSREQEAAAKKRMEDILAEPHAPAVDVYQPVAERQPRVMARGLVEAYADSSIMSTSDFVDRSVMNADARVVAIRRIAHPGACDRCHVVSGVLVFKHYPRLRHEQCRCSFEPVFRTDPAYQKRLARYARNSKVTSRTPHERKDGSASQFTMSAAFARGVRERGRRQLEAAKFREESTWLQSEWEGFLKDEQMRLASIVKTIPSNTYRDWAVMTSANQAHGFTGMLPVISRD